jgi:hypothetical protein
MPKDPSVSPGQPLSPEDKAAVEQHLKTVQEVIEKNNLSQLKIRNFDGTVDPPPPPPPPPGTGD